MKLFNWFQFKKDTGTESAEYLVELAKEANKRAQESSEIRQRESIERDLLYIDELMRKKNNDGPSS